MKKKIIYFLTIALFLAGAICLFLHIYRVFQPKYEIGKENPALLDENMTYDVFWLGTSHTGDIQPILLWEEEGITSYNLYCRGGGLNRVYATLQMALDYKVPQVVVLDTDQWYSEESFEEGPGDFHQTFDVFPINKSKVDAVFNTTEVKNERLELLNSFFRYHDRYDELNSKDFLEAEDVALGAHLRFDSNAFEEPELLDPIDLAAISEEDKADMENIIRIIELCKSRGIAVMLTHYPLPACDYEQQERIQQINLLAEQYGIEYLDFMYEDTLNYKCDFRDIGHMNIVGARKAENEIAHILKEKYGVVDRRADETIASVLNQKMTDFYATIATLAQNPAPDDMSITESISLICLPHYSGEVYIKNSSTGFLSKPGLVDLLEEAAACELPKLREAKENELDYLLIINKNAGVMTEFCGDEVTDIMGDPNDMEDALVALRDSDSMEVEAEIRQYAAKQ